MVFEGFGVFSILLIVNYNENQLREHVSINNFMKKHLIKVEKGMENLMVIRVEVIAPEKPLLSKHLQK